MLALLAAHTPVGPAALFYSSAVCTTLRTELLQTITSRVTELTSSDPESHLGILSLNGITLRITLTHLISEPVLRRVMKMKSG